MKLLKILPILFLISNTALANDIQIIKQGQAAPYDGYVMDNEKAINIRNLQLDLDLANKKNDILNQQTSLLNQSLTDSQKQIDNLSKEVTADKNNSTFTHALYFLSGALIVGFVSYGIYRTH